MSPEVVSHREPALVLAVLWFSGLAALFALTEIVTHGPASWHRVRRLVAYAAVVVALALAVWPIITAAVLFRRHDYLLAILPLLYALPYCVGVLILVGPLVRLWKFAQTNGLDAAKARTESWREQVRREAPTDEQYIDAQGAIWRVTSRVLMQFSLVFILPTVFLKIALGVAGAPVAWWPDFEPVSFILFASLSYLVAGAHHPGVALAISTYLFLLKFYDVVSRFETHHGVLRILSL